MGVSVALEPWTALIGVGVFVPLVLSTRHVSLGSVAGTTAVALAFVAMALADWNPVAYLWFAVVTGAIITFAHRDNVRRLLRGTERRLGERTK